ncbi:hypothetical protein ACI2IX_19370 [Leifsonia aquatica]|uniref:hypothetical protein n=1 Tax=Leifsonia aquatica TaxID=144185 RepID=UPI00384ACB2F
MNDAPGLAPSAPWRRGLYQFRRRQSPTTYAVLGVLLLGVLFFGAIIASATDAPGTGTTVTGKHHRPAWEDCDTYADGCVWREATWRLDILSGRIANTITVDQDTYDRYDVGDSYQR